MVVIDLDVVFDAASCIDTVVRAMTISCFVTRFGGVVPADRVAPMGAPGLAAQFTAMSTEEKIHDN